jgi:hypothetical protein
MFPHSTFSYLLFERSIEVSRQIGANKTTKILGTGPHQVIPLDTLGTLPPQLAMTLY